MAIDRRKFAALEEFRTRFTGEIIEPGAPGFDAARTLFNAMIDKQPAVIAQCETPDDVAAAIHFGREQSLEIAIRGGGHSVAGKSLTDGGLVIDLRRLNGVSVDPERGIATVGGGALMRDLDRATEPFDLVTTGGRVSTTGVGGYTLGGGTGWLDRKYGLACDNLLAAELVLADGSRVRASEDEHPDLLWALHGGGGNFGVVTSFTFTLYPLPSVTAFLLLWEPGAGPEVARAYRDFMADAPDEVGVGLVYITAPDEEFVPRRLVGRLACAIIGAYAGPERDARRVMAPLLDLGHAGGLIAELPYAELQCLFDDPPGYRNYWSAEYLNSFPDEAVDRFCNRAADMIVPSPSQHVLFPQGGAIARGPADFPVPGRSAPWCVHPFGLWDDPADDARAIQWAHDVRADLKSWTSGAVYLNFIGEEGQDRVVAGLGRENYARLAGIKARYDPDNLFHLNHNVLPLRAAASAAAGENRP